MAGWAPYFEYWAPHFRASLPYFQNQASSFKFRASRNVVFQVWVSRLLCLPLRVFRTRLRVQRVFRCQWEVGLHTFKLGLQSSTVGLHTIKARPHELSVRSWATAIGPHTFECGLRISRAGLHTSRVRLHTSMAQGSHWR